MRSKTQGSNGLLAKSGSDSVMANSLLLSFILGASVVGAPAITDRVLKHRVPEWARAAVGLTVAVMAALVVVLVGRALKF